MSEREGESSMGDRGILGRNYGTLNIEFYYTFVDLRVLWL